MPIRETYKPTYGPPTEAVKKDPIAGQKYREHLDLIKQLNKRDIEIRDLIAALQQLTAQMMSEPYMFAFSAGTTNGGGLITPISQFGCVASLTGASIRLSYDTPRRDPDDYVCGGNLVGGPRYSSHSAKSVTGLDTQFTNSAGASINPSTTSVRYFLWCSGLRQ